MAPEIKLAFDSETLNHFAFASRVRAEALKVRCFLHRFILYAAVFAAFRCFATAGWMCALLASYGHKSNKPRILSRVPQR
jgi:hypothetical protein